ncbi:hypothetical protein BDV95DRAFT_554195 [Massariosphaeria phaeospora]|uniref:Uncharacterized protein n=1 Tax=Massariosphaeria phaeospora TaxID=100035 RepID=A0A7C8HZ01_9PLEO|nr:hypothetical protein BDV95DRAFT_554195 [Massariosphaeria phaeospora]
MARDDGPSPGDVAAAAAAAAASPASSDAPATVPATARVRRRARKRNGPPQFQFLTATDPSQFKDETAKRSVRSQAMIQYRYKSGQQKERNKESQSPSPLPSQSQSQSQSPSPLPSPSPSPSPGTPTTTGRLPVAERITPIMATGLPLDAGPPSHWSPAAEDEHHLYPSTSAAWWGTNPDASPPPPSWVPATAALMPAQHSRYRRALLVLPLNEAAQRVIEYEDSDEQERVLTRMLAAQLTARTHVTAGIDAFSVLPQFASPGVSSVHLVRRCNRVFVAPETAKMWLPAMLSHPHILLSSTVLASTWLDMHAGYSGDSKRTVYVKGEIIGWINERLRSVATQFEDSTLQVILHLLVGEMWSCNEKTLRIHQSGVARLIAQRGGLHRLGGDGAMAHVAAACNYHSDIFCEATPLPLFYNWEPPKFRVVDNLAAIPESPLFCPRSEFFTILKDPRCSETTYELLCDMRDLTDLFLAHNVYLDTVLDVEAEEDKARLGPSFLNYDAKIAGIRARLASLPSAYTPGLPTTEDWVYESCRIASIIYTSAIIMRVPLSTAAQPNRNIILADTASATNSITGGHPVTTRLTEALYEVLEKSDAANVWHDMSGVLYWVASVGAAAARAPASINILQTPMSRSEAYTTWVRRCMIMYATRSMILLIFRHPIPVVTAQKRLLKVQELIGSGSSRRLVA